MGPHLKALLVEIAEILWIALLHDKTVSTDVADVTLASRGDSAPGSREAGGPSVPARRPVATPAS